MKIVPYEFFIGLRYLKGTKKGISLTTFISIFGVTVGVAALIATLAIMTGFKEELRNKILGANSHIVIQSLIGDEMENVEPLVDQVKKGSACCGCNPLYSSSGSAFFRCKRNGHRASRH